MGREAFAEVSYAGRSGKAKVLLEAEGIIARRPVGMTIARASIRALAVEGGDLTGQADQGPFRLSLGAGEALKWKANLDRPLPTLAAKMGLRPGLAVWTLGPFEGSELVEALTGVVPVTPEQAVLGVARVTGPEAAEAVAACAPSPVWIVHDKGRAAVFGEAAVRTAMRAAGWIDSKACAVSATLSATRYGRRPAESG
ncbi:hypothetical protein [Brevundimonas subvibrioides]|uniref:Uncharacterized protein n=1 Tax=Brevundimonas subvibrioides (strain ATCC 15264 / DSM 4735 / LMG 14903 / NBRC 16000 / CB 81) TaxID=633149 RepID=D9QMH1_BRESC|nr:hypothetical protein [Brevundimonas subvibrioides]ADL00141.1 conserved hypothetical protein [Brevundimonas subvibrioides ATCC 15264]